jgi:transposase
VSGSVREKVRELMEARGVTYHKACRILGERGAKVRVHTKARAAAHARLTKRILAEGEAVHD